MLDLGQVYFSRPGTGLRVWVHGETGQSTKDPPPLGLGPSKLSFIFWILISPQGPYLQETQRGTSEVCSWSPHQLSTPPPSGRSSQTLIQRAWRTSRQQLSLGSPLQAPLCPPSSSVGYPILPVSHFRGAAPRWAGNLHGTSPAQRHRGCQTLAETPKARGLGSWESRKGGTQGCRTTHPGHGRPCKAAVHWGHCSAQRKCMP